MASALMMPEAKSKEHLPNYWNNQARVLVFCPLHLRKESLKFLHVTTNLQGDTPIVVANFIQDL